MSGLPLFVELPLRGLLGNSYAYWKIKRLLRWALREPLVEQPDVLGTYAAAATYDLCIRL